MQRCVSEQRAHRFKLLDGWSREFLGKKLINYKNFEII